MNTAVIIIKMIITKVKHHLNHEHRLTSVWLQWTTRSNNNNDNYADSTQNQWAPINIYVSAVSKNNNMNNSNNYILQWKQHLKQWSQIHLYRTSMKNERSEKGPRWMPTPWLQWIWLKNTKNKERERESILPKWQDGQHQHKTDNMQANKMNMFTCTWLQWLVASLQKCSAD